MRAETTFEPCQRSHIQDLRSPCIHESPNPASYPKSPPDAFLKWPGGFLAGTGWWLAGPEVPDVPPTAPETLPLLLACCSATDANKSPVRMFAAVTGPIAPSLLSASTPLHLSISHPQLMNPMGSVSRSAAAVSYADVGYNSLLPEFRSVGSDPR
jgi:hypothetical protein